MNHDASSPLYGDVWLSGEHGTFSALFAHATQRGYVDRTAGWPGFEDAKDVWEHLHPNITWDLHPDWWINGVGLALSLDPRDGTPWGSNEYRTAYVDGYGANLAWDQFGMGPWNASTTATSQFMDVWPDGGNPLGPGFDAVRSMSHCPDGTLWIGSLTHGLARVAPDRATIGYVSGGVLEDGVSAVACDPSDGSVWVGLAKGGVTRLRNGALEPVDATGLPAFASHPVQSIQINRWSVPRVVYFAFVETGQGAGGVASYDGP